MFILVFDISSKQSFDAMEFKLAGMLLRACRGTPVLLVGNGSEARGGYNNKQPAISVLEGRQAAGRIGAIAYIECSCIRSLFCESYGLLSHGL